MVAFGNGPACTPHPSRSTTKMANIGIPTKLLHEALGHVITVELKTGQVYRGKLFEAEDSLSISLTLVTVTHRDGRVTQLDQVYIRGSSIRFYVVPDMLSQAPMFKRVGPNALKGRGIGAARGRATIMRAQARRGRGTGGGSRPPIRR
ncbi:hypothetical protein MVLG_06302 [Microbotryum lychnidis-dioicae p1A1 Lamole]|uniref:Small nuclear ribonucleoprotein Sm D3 n=1 Tax=Microbotryum lychnidis-dioicae (strain p1A1 Lamole / MvSl-1064) TaxID=683840 RepID=U5HGV3_USTV1|nr:hypothetical protein MVLG_06302 [Microbotryum lychnidis-dioicae p1A1 Lamole]|eukprot:KDE03215.1 hypothetical protein MVLG_06302 [Microbotryum lychnidis-dioicae p1A1 Lamole]